MKSTKITKPVLYRNFIVRPLADGSYDLIDPHTGRWANFPTQRYAKWSSSFMSNITARFEAHKPLTKIPEVSP